MSSIKKHISNNDLDKAFDELEKVSQTNKHLYNEVLAQKSRFVKLKKDRRTGIYTPSHLNQEESFIIKSLLELSDELDFQVKKSNSFIKITLRGDLEDFSQKKEQHLVKIISAILEIEPNKIEIKQVLKGSIVIILKLPEESAEELNNLYTTKDNKIERLLNEFNLINIQMIDFGQKKIDSKIKEITHSFSDQLSSKISEFIDSIEEERLKSTESSLEEYAKLIESERLKNLKLELKLAEMESESEKRLKILEIKQENERKMLERRYKHEIKNYRQFLESLESMRAELEKHFPKAPRTLILAIYKHSKSLIQAMWDSTDEQGYNEASKKLLNLLIAISKDTQDVKHRKENNFPQRTMDIIKNKEK